MSDVQEPDAIPEVASVPLQLIPTGWLYQPLWSGERTGVALTEGSVSSYLKPKLVAADVFPALSVQQL